MQRCVAVFIVTAVLMALGPGSTTAAAQSAAQSITVIVNGEHLIFDVSPESENGCLLVPLRATFEALGATVNWDDDTGTITATKGIDTLKIAVGQRTAYRNNTAIELDVPAKSVNLAGTPEGKTLIPIRFVAEALGAVVLDTTSRIVRINQKDELELLAGEKVEQYLSLLDRAAREGINDEEWNGILSQKAIKSGYGHESSVYKPEPVADSSVRSVSNIVIMRAAYVKEPVSSTCIFVTARYIYNDPTEREAANQKVHYEKEYCLVWENGQLVIDNERTLAIQRADDIPLADLSKKDIKQIKRKWQQNNYYNYNDVIDINNNFISSTLSATFGIIKWGDASASPVKEQLEYLFSYFTDDVLESNGWEDFTGLPAKRDPVFTILWATSAPDQISATLFAELFPGFSPTPAIMEVEIKKQPNGLNGEEWIFTRIDKVRSYADLSELKQKEPQIYEMLVLMDNYHRMIRQGQIT